MAEVRVEHTYRLDTAIRDAIWRLLDAAFAGDVDNHDFEHALGGMHALVWDGAELIGHGSVVLRRLLHNDRALRTGYLEAVAVHPARQRQGHGGAVMAALERIIRAGYEVGALGSSDSGQGTLRGAGLAPVAGHGVGDHPRRSAPDARGGRLDLCPAGQCTAVAQWGSGLRLAGGRRLVAGWAPAVGRPAVVGTGGAGTGAGGGQWAPAVGAGGAAPAGRDRTAGTGAHGGNGFWYL